MLDHISKLLHEPCITFEEYFQNYVIEVQDSSIDEEVSFLMKNNFPSVNSLIKLTNKEVKGMW